MPQQAASYPHRCWLNGSREDQMTTESIQKVQALLTVDRNGDRKKKIIDVEVLLKRHKAESVLSLLEGLLKEKQNHLIALIVTDESIFEIDETIGIMFRLHLAIRRLEREVEGAKITCQN
jgi:hypothetical protein